MAIDAADLIKRSLNGDGALRFQRIAIFVPVEDQKIHWQANLICAGNDANLQRTAGVQVHIPLGKRNGNAGLFKLAEYLPV